MLIFDLPWPPSVNRYWRHISRGALAGRVLISKHGREYRRTIVTEIAHLRLPPLTGRLAVHVDAYPPDKRIRDLDNIVKALFDVLTHAGVINDDGNIDHFSVTRRNTTAGGLVRVQINTVDEAYAAIA